MPSMQRNAMSSMQCNEMEFSWDIRDVRCLVRKYIWSPIIYGKCQAHAVDLGLTPYGGVQRSYHNASDVNRLSNATETSIMLCGKAQPPLVGRGGIEPPTTSFLCQCSKRLSYLDKGISVTDPGGREGTSKCVKNICFGRGRLPFASTGALYIYDMLVCNKATFWDFHSAHATLSQHLLLIAVDYSSMQIWATQGSSYITYNSCDKKNKHKSKQTVQ